MTTASAERLAHRVAHDHLFLVDGLSERLRRFVAANSTQGHGRAGPNLRLLAFPEERALVEHLIEERHARVAGERAKRLEHRHAFREIGAADLFALDDRLDL